MSIQVLDKNVIDQIAAGEVVERPSHLVKELIENSIDAKASQIEVYFENGGRDIEIIDNGVGIAKADFHMALQRHATSKIVNFDDIWHLSSFGFRGEALASIAAVSDFELISRTQRDEKAYRLSSEFGQQKPLLETSHSPGTRITIRNLFENVPVRLKFLKSSSYEHSLIKQVIKAMALSQPQIEFKIYENRKLLFYYPKAKNLKDRANAVLNLKDVYSLSVQRDDGQIEVVFSSPYQVEKNTKNIWLFVQNRWVQDKTLVAAILESYQNLLMHGEYPQVVLKLDLAAEQVDVNIHPTKSQIKFLNSQTVFRFVNKTLRQEIEKAPWKKMGEPSFNAGDFIKKDLDSVNFESRNPTSQASFSGFAFERSQYKQKEYSVSEHRENSPWQQVSAFSTKSTTETDESIFLWSRLQVIGQLNLTYLVCQDESKMILVDQHAAHERVLFEKFKSQLEANNVSIQNLLIPLSMDLEADQIETLETYKSSLQKLGIDFELLGPSTLGILSRPSFLKENAIVQLIRKFIDEVKEQGGSFVFEKKINDLIATMACHSAIRAGQALSQQEMEQLLVSMDEFPLSSFCPHGRPVNVDFSFKQIEKDFGRIV